MSDDKTVVPGFIRGYRLWGLVGYSGMQETNYLYGVGHQYPWNRGPMLATCSNGAAHPAPYRKCRCGLYAMYEPVGLMQPPSRVPGIIDAWGTTILGTTGFRAEKAVIRALWLPGGLSPEKPIRAAGDFYGVPVFENRAEAVEAFPPTDVSELIGPVDPGIGYRSNHAGGMAIDLAASFAAGRKITVNGTDITDYIARAYIRAVEAKDQP